MLETELLSGIETSLRLHIEDNAVFLAERLFAEFPSQASLLKVAECYRANNDTATALRLLKHYAPFTQLRAKSNMTAAPSTLDNNTSNNNHAHPLYINWPRWKLNYLLGVLSAKSHEYAEAVRALQPLLGCSVMIDEAEDHDRSGGGRDDDHAAAAAAAASYEHAVRKEAQQAEAGARYWIGVCSLHMGHADVASSQNTPSTLFNQAVVQAPALFSAFDVGVKKCDLGGVATTAAATTTDDGAPSSNNQFHVYAALTSQQQQQQQHGNSVIAPSLLPEFLMPFAEVLRLISGTYECSAAIRVLLHQMPLSQKFSGWCLEQMAMAHFHAGRNQDAIAAFEQLRQREPWRLNTPAMVYYSTCLWHGRQEVQLCALAQRMIDCIPRSPFTLCVVGNCHSLNRDARAACTMFSRAATVDPTFAYAHTLRGHELLALEDLQDAEAAFYEALRWDKRHYAAHAGIGEYHFRLEKEGPARENFRKALAINKTLPAVLCRLAATYHRVGCSQSELEIALSTYEAALQRCPSHLPSAQQRAAILVRLGRLKEAQAALAKLLTECPEEPALHVAMGKCQAKLGDSDEAVRQFHKAMDLDPRRQASVRVLLDRVAAKKDVDAVEQ